jgi:hypothetical protein
MVCRNGGNREQRGREPRCSRLAYRTLPRLATVSACQAGEPLTAQQNLSRCAAPSATMFTLLPLTVIDGAENVVPAPATFSACQVGEPLTAQ